MITLFLNMQIVHAGISHHFSEEKRAAYTKEQKQQETLEKLKEDVQKEFKKRRNFNPQERQKQLPILQTLTNRSEKLLEELQADAKHYDQEKWNKLYDNTKQRIREVKLQIELVKHQRMDTGERYG